jgi:hypothetical protein
LSAAIKKRGNLPVIPEVVMQAVPQGEVTLAINATHAAKRLLGSTGVITRLYI